MALAVSSGFSQYSLMIRGPFSKSSPGSPIGISLVLVSISTIFKSLSGKRIPTLPGLRLPLGLTMIPLVVSEPPKPSIIVEPVTFSKYLKASTGNGAEPDRRNWIEFALELGNSGCWFNI